MKCEFRYESILAQLRCQPSDYLIKFVESLSIKELEMLNSMCGLVVVMSNGDIDDIGIEVEDE